MAASRVPLAAPKRGGPFAVGEIGQRHLGTAVPHEKSRARGAVHLRFIGTAIVRARGCWGTRSSEATMKIPLFVAVTAVVLLATGSVLAVMNNACKTSHHPWCAPSTEFHHQTIGRS